MPTPAPPRWFAVREVGPQIYRIAEPGHVNSYLVNGCRYAALIDTGMGFRPLRPTLAHLTRTALTVFNPHWHFDHVMGNPEFADIGISGLESDLLRRPIANIGRRRLSLDPCRVKGLPLPSDFDIHRYRYPAPPNGA